MPMPFAQIINTLQFLFMKNVNHFLPMSNRETPRDIRWEPAVGFLTRSLSSLLFFFCFFSFSTRNLRVNFLFTSYFLPFTFVFYDTLNVSPSAPSISNINVLIAGRNLPRSFTCAVLVHIFDICWMSWFTRSPARRKETSSSLPAATEPTETPAMPATPEHD